ncbi:hypothetical protein PPYR_00055 [Photinus pyralis]|uniref:HTH CENPB-type domain-containing protein n=1 Tax=Photinus pyralis TaxID=7054 RepID=A0A5N4B0H0_PHOPY|nr:hypothetical protein PPYR_00055 [Photinus pyralis]
MVRKQKPRQIGKTSVDVMTATTKLVLEENYSLRRAAEAYDISFITLRRYVLKKRSNPDADIKMSPNYSVRQILTEEQEVRLAEYINTCSKMAYGLSTKECRRLAWEMADVNKLSVPISWTANKQAGVEWLRQFMKRRKNLSIRQPEACSLSRLTSFNPHNVKKFFDQLKQIFEKKPQLVDPSRIFNLDETGTSTVQKPRKIVAEKGSKQVSQCSSAERGSLVTSCAIICANGTYLPPAMVFPRKYFKTHMVAGAPPGTLGLATPNGWMTAELFSARWRAGTIDYESIKKFAISFAMENWTGQERAFAVNAFYKNNDSYEQARRDVEWPARFPNLS